MVSILHQQHKYRKGPVVVRIRIHLDNRWNTPCSGDEVPKPHRLELHSRDLPKLDNVPYSHESELFLVYHQSTYFEVAVDRA